MWIMDVEEIVHDTGTSTSDGDRQDDAVVQEKPKQFRNPATEAARAARNKARHQIRLMHIGSQLNKPERWAEGDVHDVQLLSRTWVYPDNGMIIRGTRNDVSRYLSDTVLCSDCVVMESDSVDTKNNKGGGTLICSHWQDADCTFCINFIPLDDRNNAKAEHLHFVRIMGAHSPACVNREHWTKLYPRHMDLCWTSGLIDTKLIELTKMEVSTPYQKKYGKFAKMLKNSEVLEVKTRENRQYIVYDRQTKADQAPTNSKAIPLDTLFAEGFGPEHISAVVEVGGALSAAPTDDSVLPVAEAVEMAVDRHQTFASILETTQNVSASGTEITVGDETTATRVAFGDMTAQSVVLLDVPDSSSQMHGLFAQRLRTPPVIPSSAPPPPIAHTGTGTMSARPVEEELNGCRVLMLLDDVDVQGTVHFDCPMHHVKFDNGEKLAFCHQKQVRHMLVHQEDNESNSAATPAAAANEEDEPYLTQVEEQLHQDQPTVISVKRMEEAFAATHDGVGAIDVGATDFGSSDMVELPTATGGKATKKRRYSRRQEQQPPTVHHALIPISPDSDSCSLVSDDDCKNVGFGEGVLGKKRAAVVADVEESMITGTMDLIDLSHPRDRRVFVDMMTQRADLDDDIAASMVRGVFHGKLVVARTVSSSDSHRNEGQQNSSESLQQRKFGGGSRSKRGNNPFGPKRSRIGHAHQAVIPACEYKKEGLVWDPSVCPEGTVISLLKRLRADHADAHRSRSGDICVLKYSHEDRASKSKATVFQRALVTIITNLQDGEMMAKVFDGDNELTVKISQLLPLCSLPEDLLLDHLTATNGSGRGHSLPAFDSDPLQRSYCSSDNGVGEVERWTWTELRMFCTAIKRFDNDVRKVWKQHFSEYRSLPQVVDFYYRTYCPFMSKGDVSKVLKVFEKADLLRNCS